MSREPSPPIPDSRSSPSQNPLNAATPAAGDGSAASAAAATTSNAGNNHTGNSSTAGGIVRRERPSRACTVRSAARLHAAAAAEAAAVERKPRPPKRERHELCEGEPAEEEQCSSSSKIVTPLVSPPPPSLLPRWSLRSMWELASILNFLNVFRPLLNISVEFSAEEFETALITPPNDTLSDVHIPLLKAIPPVTRMALGRNTWVTVLCRKLRDWWHWVADGEIPIVASHGAEVDVYNTLDPGVRVTILKALCDIRVEQEDIRNYIDDSIKHGVHLSAFRKERVGGDSQGISYWYEEDPIIGHRLYREIRKVEVKKEKKRGVHPPPTTSYLWETVATNFDEFQEVSDKLLSSKNRTEASLGKKLKIDMLPEVEKVHKRKEKLLKKQHRQALLLDNFLSMDGLAPGRSLRHRKAVTYTFDDYDRSINEAIKITKRKQPSPEPSVKREEMVKPEASTNGKWSGHLNDFSNLTFSAPSPSSEYDDLDEEHKLERFDLDRSTRRRQRPQRYSAKEFVEAVSDNEEAYSDSDDEIVGEAVYDEEYLRKRKQRRKLSSSSEGEGDEEYRGDEENVEDEEEEEEEEEDSYSASEDSDQPRRFKKLPGRTRREAKLRSVDELQSGLRRSKRSTRNRINYRQYELSESETESMKLNKSNIDFPDVQTDASDDVEYSGESQDFDRNEDNEPEMKVEQHQGDYALIPEGQHQLPKKPNGPDQSEVEGVSQRRFLDLNEVAPGSGFDDVPNSITRDEDTDDF